MTGVQYRFARVTKDCLERQSFVPLFLAVWKMPERVFLPEDRISQACLLRVAVDIMFLHWSPTCLPEWLCREEDQERLLGLWLKLGSERIEAMRAEEPEREDMPGAVPEVPLTGEPTVPCPLLGGLVGPGVA
jgi:hypothetical protein